MAVSGEHFAMAAHLPAGQLAIETIQQPLEQLDLPLVEWSRSPALPETRLHQHHVHRVLGVIHCAMQRIQEPRKPSGDIERPALGLLEDVVVGAALRLDLRGQTVEALRAAVGACEQQVAYGPGDPARCRHRKDAA